MSWHLKVQAMALVFLMQGSMGAKIVDSSCTSGQGRSMSNCFSQVTFARFGDRSPSLNISPGKSLAFCAFAPAARVARGFTASLSRRNPRNRRSIFRRT